MIAKQAADDMKQEIKQNPKLPFTLIRAGEAQSRESSGDRRLYYFSDMVDMVLVTSTRKHFEPPHLHASNPEIYYVIHGRLRMNVNGDDILLDAGDLVVVSPGICHSFETTGEKLIFIAIKKEPGLKDKQLC